MSDPIPLERERNQNRHILTRLYLDDGSFRESANKATRFGLWKAPDIDLTGAIQYEVPPNLAGRIDIIAADVYGDPSLWWAIALVNNIKNPFNEVVGCMILVIPQQKAIDQSLSTETRNRNYLTL